MQRKSRRIPLRAGPAAVEYAQRSTTGRGFADPVTTPCWICAAPVP
ncbi:hypothetical protein [Lysobacter sp. CA199]